ncbi:MAG: hypothetical protein ACYC9J_05820 [Sulfuricaulis sp.]
MGHLFQASSFATLHTLKGVLYVAVVLGMLGAIFALRHLMPVFFLAVFPATAVHELTHLGAALLLNGKPAGLSLIPRRSDSGYVLGSLRCANVRWYNGLFIGLAPLVLFVVALALLEWRTRGSVTISHVEALWAYAIACLIYAAFPSWQDIKMALASSWLLVTLSMMVAWYYWIR